MSKVIAVMDKPKDCQQCVFGVCKYSHPFWSRKKPSMKGYYCQLLPPEQRVVQDFDYDAEVHLNNCSLVPVPEKEKIIWPGVGAIGERYNEGWNACIDAITASLKE